MLPVFLALAAVIQPAPALTAAETDARLDCDLHKFEKVVTAKIDGADKTSRLRLCGTEGQSDAEWIKTLRDSAAKLRANDKLAVPIRDAMVAALGEEVERLKLGKSLAAINRSIAPAGSTTAPIGGSQFTLKPRAPIKKSEGSMRDYAALPPLPEVKAGENVASLAKAPPKIVRPELRFQCYSSEDLAEGPCDILDRYSTVVLSARSATAPGTSLVFAVDGDEREELDIGGMRKGQSRRIPLSAAVCRGVSSARLELRTMVIPIEGKFGPQAANRDGPFILKCQ